MAQETVRETARRVAFVAEAACVAARIAHENRIGRREFKKLVDAAYTRLERLRGEGDTPPRSIW